MKNKFVVTEGHPFFEYRVRIFRIVFFILPLLCMLLVESMARSSANEALLWVFSRFAAALYNYVIYLAVFGLLISMINRLSVAAPIYTAIMLVFGYANHYKFGNLGFYVNPYDLLNQTNLGEAGNLFINYIPRHAIVLFFVGLVAAILIFVLLQNKHRLNIKQRFFLCLGSMVVVAIGCFTFSIQDTFMNNALNLTEFMAFAPQLDFEDNGMLATFMGYITLDDRTQLEPDGYGSNTIGLIEQQLFEMEHQDTNSTQPDKVIIILSEALIDPTRLQNLYMSTDPIPDMREDMIGTAISPAVGGSTSNGEFEVLTGFSMYPIPDGTITYTRLYRSLPSVATYFKDMGYQAIAIHTNPKGWYRRSEVFPLLGFDDFISSESMVNAEIKGSFISDMEMTRQIINYTDNDEKQFVFAITMENHGTYYLPKQVDGGEPPDIEVHSDILSDVENEQILYYVQGCYDNNEMYAALKRHYEDSGQKVIIAMFGDHIPRVGEDVLVKLGYYTGLEDLNSRNVPLMLWSNYLNKPQPLDTPISLNYLVPTIIEYAGLPRSAFMNYLCEMKKSLPVITAWWADLEYNDLPASQSLLDDYLMLEYDALYGERYANKIYDVDQK